jgi:hypothetical protein
VRWTILRNFQLKQTESYSSNLRGNSHCILKWRHLHKSHQTSPDIVFYLLRTQADEVCFGCIEILIKHLIFSFFSNECQIFISCLEAVKLAYSRYISSTYSSVGFSKPHDVPCRTTTSWLACIVLVSYLSYIYKGNLLLLR